MHSLDAGEEWCAYTCGEGRTAVLKGMTDRGE